MIGLSVVGLLMCWVTGNILWLVGSGTKYLFRGEGWVSCINLGLLVGLIFLCFGAVFVVGLGLILAGFGVFQC